MSTTLTAPASATPTDRLLTRPVLLTLWLCALALLLIAPGRVPVSRTQEARVLETARQMLTSPEAHPYLIPTLNNQLRLQKPPLAYWLTAASYKVFGISPASGRLPAILAGWGTLAFTYLAGSWLFNRRTGLLAAAALLSSYLFYRYTRLAETDTLATFFVTASCLLFWKATRPSLSPGHSERSEESSPSARGMGDPPMSSPPISPSPHLPTSSFLDFHLAAALAAGAALSKGPPAAFPVLFFLTLCLVNRDWRSLKKFLTSGCLLTLLVIATAWYAFLASHHLLTQVFHEIDDLAAGHDHGGTFLNYLPELLTSTAPWSGFFVASLVFAVQQFKRDPRVRGLLLWFLAILIPLCCVGNKQFHYLFPLTPPAMLLVAALLDHVLSLRPDNPDAKPVVAVFLGTLAVTACAAIALPATSWFLIHRLAPTDFLLAALVLVASTIVLLRYLKHGFSAGLPAYARAAAVLMPLILSLWLPPLVSDDFPTFARDLDARFGPAASYVAYNQSPKLPLCFALAKPIPYAPAKSPLPPGVIPLTAVKHDAPAPKPPPGYTTALTLQGREQDLYAYEAESTKFEAPNPKQ